MQEGGDNWKEAVNACGEGRPNDRRVRVFGKSFLCKWLKSLIDINIGKQVSKRGSFVIQEFRDSEVQRECEG
jgi:hypothetical protein